MSDQYAATVSADRLAEIEARVRHRHMVNYSEVADLLTLTRELRARLDASQAALSEQLEARKADAERIAALEKESEQAKVVWRHRKGGRYVVLHEGRIEATLEPVTIYRPLKDGSVWVRPTEEFRDGRFVRETPDD